MPMTAEQLQARHARWEELGIERVKQDLQTGGHVLVGGSPEVRQAAWDWVKAKEAGAKEVVSLKPSLWGMSVDLKAAWKKLKLRKARHG